MPAPIRDAVTAVLLHGDHLLLTQRNRGLRAFPGYTAFPGGKVDRADADSPVPEAKLAGIESRLAHALARELKEEVAFDLFDGCRTGLVRSVTPIGEAIAPPFIPMRFHTRFYKVVLDAEQPRPELRHDPGELEGLAWRPVSEWWTLYEQGSLLLAPPTMVVVRALARDGDLETVEDLKFDFDPAVETPWISPIGGLRILIVRSNTLPPAAHTNAFWFGGNGHPRVIVDPSPANRGEFERLCSRLAEWGVDLVFLTHHHPDHREFAADVARRFDIPLGMSDDAQARIRKVAGDAYFDGVRVLAFGDGDTLTLWQGEPVRLLAVPGHDEGQLAPMPESRRWCIVGDLIQGVGTVVIAPPEGDMGKYFATLRKVIDLDPKVIIPSHGIALGSAWYLQAALAHREERERVIGGLHRAGRSEDEILEEVYQGVDPRLMPLARINIRSHLQKLLEENALAGKGTR